MSSVACSIGALLEERRKQLGLTVEEAAKAVKIRSHYLLSIEQGELTALPSPVYGVGYIRSYAGFLGLNGGEIIAELKAAATIPEASTDLYVPGVYREDALPGPFAIFLSALLVLVIYGIWYYLNHSDLDHTREGHDIISALNEYGIISALEAPNPQRPAGARMPENRDYALFPLLEKEESQAVALLYANQPGWIAVMNGEGVLQLHYIRKGEWYSIGEGDVAVMGREMEIKELK